MEFFQAQAFAEGRARKRARSTAVAKSAAPLQDFFLVDVLVGSSRMLAPNFDGPTSTEMRIHALRYTCSIRWRDSSCSHLAIGNDCCQNSARMSPPGPAPDLPETTVKQ
jgi:hypothetical protein